MYRDMQRLYIYQPPVHYHWIGWVQVGKKNLSWMIIEETFQWWEPHISNILHNRRVIVLM